jgi:hypothetical protein
MKVRIVTVVEVDAVTWKKAAGLPEETKPRKVQNDLRAYVESGIHESLGAMELMQEVEATIETRQE